VEDLGVDGRILEQTLKG